MELTSINWSIAMPSLRPLFLCVGFVGQREEYVSLSKWADLNMYAYVLGLFGAAKDVRVAICP